MQYIASATPSKDGTISHATNYTKKAKYHPITGP